ncbi:hypothetical protein HBH70_101980 [Parastagonospora nodorum]|nr:hypothetical protein HBH52_233930 [Parastagonospora nodorum]KAH4063943.1 hypothetical protein HBH50_180200 [Parastagonospora nodorum]KAH4087325.1 hypothetical protein HBH48_130520 [Parastagonospora nodorum]KAH4258335.1 hypothetical protein HBI04_218480 [Parastagonospora nodorum]KAH4266229.1 hypothetical protein HBI03_071610 [Parastagonospora nodorum]
MCRMVCCALYLRSYQKKPNDRGTVVVSMCGAYPLIGWYLSSERQEFRYRSSYPR